MLQKTKDTRITYISASNLLMGRFDVCAVAVPTFFFVLYKGEINGRINTN